MIYLKTRTYKEFDWDAQLHSRFYVAGHLPAGVCATKGPNLLNRRDQYSMTFVTFSPNGKEILANMGSEQIYLFDVFNGNKIIKETPDFATFLKKSDPLKEGPQNGFHPPDQDSLPPNVLELKLRANSEYNAERYTKAIEIYNQAISLSWHPVLLSNRAAALLKRNWNGDVYQALLDSFSVIQLEPAHLKAHLRLMKCLIELKWFQEAKLFMSNFKLRFPQQADIQNLKQLEKRLEEVKEELRRHQLKKRKGFMVNRDQTDSETESELDEPYVIPPRDEYEVQVEKMKLEATDFRQRFCGHCNVTTDIKETNFFGRYLIQDKLKYSKYLHTSHLYFK